MQKKKSRSLTPSTLLLHLYGLCLSPSREVYLLYSWAPVTGFCRGPRGIHRMILLQAGNWDWAPLGSFCPWVMCLHCKPETWMEIINGSIIYSHLLLVPSFSLFLRNMNTVFHYKWSHHKGKKLIKRSYFIFFLFLLFLLLLLLFSPTFYVGNFNHITNVEEFNCESLCAQQD